MALTVMSELVVRKTLAVVFLFICTPKQVQPWLPEFRIRLGYSTVMDRNSTLNEFLQFEHPLVAGDCDARMSVFYFRVNSKGIVDSLYSEVNFALREREVINKNILNTSRNWILPKSTTSGDKCWFVFPCFILGRNSKYCSTDHEYTAQLEEVRKKLLTNGSQGWDAQGRYVLRPNIIGSMSRK